MARDPDALKIQKWAATGDVEDPEDGGIVRKVGWDATYSQPGGNLPKREHINQLFRELSAQGVEVKVHGAGLEWDSSISYEHPAMVMGSDARLYVSVQNSAGADPTSDIINSHWALLESQGPVGSPGMDGSDGSDGSDAIQFDTAANRPAAAAANNGTLYFATDTEDLSYDNGGTWVQITASLPPGAIAFFAGACPTGWTEYTSARGRYIVGTPSGGTNGATVGTALSNSEDRAVGQHNHAITDPNHSHTRVGIRDCREWGSRVSSGIFSVRAVSRKYRP